MNKRERAAIHMLHIRKNSYIYFIYTPNLRLGIAVSVREMEQGRFRGSTEGARGKGWRLFIMYGYGSHDTFEFLDTTSFHSHSLRILHNHCNHLMCIFQPVKHHHSEAVNHAIATRDKSFTKVKFLAASNNFQSQAFKTSTIHSAWAQIGRVLYNPDTVLEKVRKSLPPPRDTTPEAPGNTDRTRTPRPARFASRSPV